MAEPVEVSIVIPVYNEAPVLDELYARLKKTVQGMGRSCEIVFVDDGSTDGSYEILKRFKENDCTLRIVRFTRNFGQQAAVLAGFRQSRGQVVVQLDSDLQNPPEEIPRLLEAMTPGVDLVVTVPRKRRDAWSRVAGSGLLRWLTQKMLGPTVKLNLSSFRALRPSVVEKINQCRDRSQFMAVLMSWMGVPTVEVEVEHHVRSKGKTKYGYTQLIQLAWDIVTGYSTFPLRLVTYMGIFGALTGFAMMAFLLYQRLVRDILVDGLVVLSAVFAFLAGVQLLSFGFLGEYLGRVHLQVQDRPPYLIEKVIE
ncbi:MAG: glycosyltransferase [Nitrospinae bacterium CG11_big_fil_rev_8_21_14_0_20_56_8]|nr:MAG: glycosyltransferase [Nitrospinae bacterium CG11_big_fil_rev_8_21_14_0_20_56_8]